METVEGNEVPKQDHPEVKESEELLPSIRNKGIMKRARWLSFCLSIGWRKDQLEALGKIWDEHHSISGELK